jgi:sulfate permease, SulP family
LPNLTSNLRGDIFGGITAAVVALPLALAFGVTSGIGAIAGLYGAIAVGFFAAVFGGTRAQVSGPTGPMTVVMGAIVADHAGNLPEAFAIVFLGGAFQILFGLLKVGKYVSYTPSSVVSGFMSGIGVIIIIIQTLPFFGLPSVAGGPLGALHAWPTLIGDINFSALMIGIFSLAVVIAWPKRLQRIFPPALAALTLGTLLGYLFLQDAPTIGQVPTGLPEIYIPVSLIGNLPSLLEPALILALLGSIDSLLTSLVADSITRTRHRSNKELIGQGIGNMVSGLIGGLPGAGATMRTVVNVRAGGQTPLSGALHALILLGLVMGLGPLAEDIPLAVLAGILIKVGWDIIDWGYLKHAHRAPRDKVLVMFVTLGLTVFVDLITAVAVGLILAGFVTARWMEKEELKGITALALPQSGDALNDEEKSALKEFADRIAIVSLRGRFSYASAREMVQQASALNPGSNVSLGNNAVIYDLTNTAHIDTSAALAIQELLATAMSKSVDCYVTGLSGTAENTLESLGVLDALPAGNVLPTLLEGIRTAAQKFET